MSILPRPKAHLSLSSARSMRPALARIGSALACVTGLTLAAGPASATPGFESVFDCGDVIGKVFDDKNRNGYQDKGERGLPGVRVASARGLLSITDQFGRYHVTCAQLPRGGIGSNFVLKLDARSLPVGYRITTENPRAVRLTSGRVTKLNFGASLARVVRLNLEGAAFEPNGTSLKPEWSGGIDQLISVLDGDPSVLRVIYRQGADDAGLVNKRMRAISRLVAQRWEQRDGDYPLDIERRTIVGK